MDGRRPLRRAVGLTPPAAGAYPLAVPPLARIWLYPLVVLFAISALIFVGGYYVDAAARPPAGGLLHALFTPSPEGATTLGNVGQVVCAVLGIAITVVAIIVELSANRYTARITELFFRDPVNFAVIGLFVVSCLECLWVALSFSPAFVPRAGTIVSMTLMTVSLLLLVPYFAYVFHFLNPMRIIERIERAALSAMVRRQDAVAAVEAIEQITDIALNAMENKDRAISMASIDSLGHLAHDYGIAKERLPADWFRIREPIRRNPDFVSLSQDSLDAIASERSWVEMKILRQYQMLFGIAIEKMRDLNYLVGINTRLIGERALDRGDGAIFTLAIKFFNTFVRSTLNVREVRTAYNLLNQYRLLAEASLRREDAPHAIEIARHFKYYGQLAHQIGAPFVLETVAYDLCTLNEVAHETGSVASDTLRRVFLELDKEEGQPHEQSLRGVRKAQLKLATFYLMRGATEPAREIYEDMKNERPERLASIRDELLAVESAEFWEIIDRGTNFDYLPPERKAKIAEFFSWFGAKLGKTTATAAV